MPQALASVGREAAVDRPSALSIMQAGKGTMGEEQVQRLVTRDLVNRVREQLQRIYLDTRRLTPHTPGFDLMMECVREALSSCLPFTQDKMEKVVDDAYALYLNFLAVEKYNQPE
jgi:hypothetical protein